MKNEPEFLSDTELQIWRQVKAKLIRENDWEDIYLITLEIFAISIGDYIEKRRRIKEGDSSIQLARETEESRIEARHWLKEFNLLDERYIPVAAVTAAGDDADIVRLFSWAFK